MRVEVAGDMRAHQLSSYIYSIEHRRGFRSALRCSSYYYLSFTKDRLKVMRFIKIKIVGLLCFLVKYGYDDGPKVRLEACDEKLH